MSRNWLRQYNKGMRRYQEGGPMGPPPGAEGGMPPEGGGAPGGDIEQMLMEYAQTRDPELAVAICDMLIEMLAQQGGGAPPPGGPEGAPAGPPAGPGVPPMGRKGMKMRRGPIFRK